MWSWRPVKPNEQVHHRTWGGCVGRRHLDSKAKGVAAAQVGPGHDLAAAFARRLSCSLNGQHGCPCDSAYVLYQSTAAPPASTRPLGERAVVGSFAPSNAVLHSNEMIRHSVSMSMLPSFLPGLDFPAFETTTFYQFIITECSRTQSAVFGCFQMPTTRLECCIKFAHAWNHKCTCFTPASIIQSLLVCVWTESEHYVGCHVRVAQLVERPLVVLGEYLHMPSQMAPHN